MVSELPAPDAGQISQPQSGRAGTSRGTKSWAPETRSACRWQARRRRRKELSLRLRDAAVVLWSVSAVVFPAAQIEAAGFEGTTWQLTKLPGHPSADLAALPRRVTLRLGEGRVTGFGGCNLLTGTYTTRGTSLTVKLASTMMACPEPGSSIERTFLDRKSTRLNSSHLGISYAV